MQWNITQTTIQGAERTIKRFCWWPTQITGRWTVVWLEYVWVRQWYYEGEWLTTHVWLYDAH